MSFYKKYIMLNLNEYDAFEGFDFYITIFLTCLALTICIGVFAANYRKNLMIKIIKQLYRHGATSEQSSKTLSELKIKNTFAVRRILSDGTQLSKIVCKEGEIKLTYDEYIAQMKAKKDKKHKKTFAEKQDHTKKKKLDDARFYIPMEKEPEAKGILSKQSTSVFQSIMVCVLIVCLTICLALVMPTLLDLLDSVL